VRLSLAPALPVGVAGEAEYGDVALREEMAADDFVCRVNAAGPFIVDAAREYPLAAASLETSIREARYRVEFGPMAEAQGSAANELARAVGARLTEGRSDVPTRRGVRNLAEEVAVISWGEAAGTLELDVAAAATGAVFDLVAYLAGASSRESRGARVTRTRVLLRDDAPSGG